ncbi:MAG: 4Fe-4S binding protein, partial [Candidatus Helarchaeota archaeon]
MPLNPQMMIPVGISYLIIMIISALLLYKGKMNKKISIIILLLSVSIPGLIFGAAASPVFAIQQIFMNLHKIIANPSSSSVIFPILIMTTLIFVLFTIVTVLLGRIFCGYACPLGAAQELVSKISFKSHLKKKKYVIRIPRKIANLVRLGFFVTMILLAIVWGIGLFEVVNPFSAFTVFGNLGNIVVIVIPLILFSIIIISNLFIYRAWCVLFCPFGFVSWLVSRFSVFKFRRNDKCTNCKACEKVCPTNEAFLTSNKSECYVCNRCFEVCPANAIDYTNKKRKDCPVEEVNPKEFKKPIKVKLQAIFFPLLSKIKKLPPPKRRWNYDKSRWEMLQKTPPKMKPQKMMQGEKVKILYNCIHCNRCKTSESRVKLKQNMFKRGQVPKEFEDLIHSYEKYKTPLNQNAMRIKKFEDIPKESSTLLFLGCFSSIKVPRFAEHAIQYLLDQNVDFTLLENEICCGLSLKVSGEKKLLAELKKENLELFKSKGFKEVICICPACYNMFRKNYKNSGIKFKFITEYLKPLKNKTS